MPLLLLLLLFLCLIPGLSAQESVDLHLPTDNHALLENDPEHFFQPTISKRITSGMYGFVRSTSPLEPPPYFDHFHEGIDIQPLRRDVFGQPLDLVRAAAPGTVVYGNDVPKNSNYGRYVMVRHRAGNFAYYTTYAHLAKINVPIGQSVLSGQSLAVMGFTGTGINRERAHVHFEIGFLINDDFPIWFEKFGKKKPDDRNDHGLYNGENFLGVDPVPLLRACAQGKPWTVPEIFARESPCFRVRVPAGRDYFSLQKRFPFLTTGTLTEPLPLAWEITCNRIGLPLAFRRSERVTVEPVLTWFDYARNFQDSFTRGLVHRQGDTAELTEEGQKWFHQLTYLPE